MNIADFWAKVEKSEGCWNWLGGHSVAKNGRYGTLYLNGQLSYAHRVSYELTHGKIPDGLKICHKCDNPNCVNPDHLFSGTQGDNIRDARKKGRMVFWNSQKSHCKKGHPFTVENTGLYNNSRYCKECKRIKFEVYRRLHPEKVAESMNRWREKRRVALST